VLLFGVVFVVVGIAFKFGAAPFHMWVPDVYHGAPTAVTLFIGSAPKLAAVRHGLSPARRPRPMLTTGGRCWPLLAVLSLVVGNLVAIAQTNLKRMLAYSTISHVGFLFLGILAAGTEQGYAAAMFYAITYALMSTAAFGAIIAAVARASRPSASRTSRASTSASPGWPS
jgi:NADH-quinone oxidoreductase subunit N